MKESRFFLLLVLILLIGVGSGIIFYRQVFKKDRVMFKVTGVDASLSSPSPNPAVGIDCIINTYTMKGELLQENAVKTQGQVFGDSLQGISFSAINDSDVVRDISPLMKIHALEMRASDKRKTESIRTVSEWTSWFNRNPSSTFLDHTYLQFRPDSSLPDVKAIIVNVSFKSGTFIDTVLVK